jgi:hypothetical protein
MSQKIIYSLSGIYVTRFCALRCMSVRRLMYFISRMIITYFDHIQSPLLRNCPVRSSVTCWCYHANWGMCCFDSGLAQRLRSIIVFGRYSVRISLGAPTTPTDNFRSFPQSLQAKAGVIPGFGHHHFLPNSLQFIIHLLSSVRDIDEILTALCCVSSSSYRKENNFGSDKKCIQIFSRKILRKETIFKNLGTEV